MKVKNLFKENHYGQDSNYLRRQEKWAMQNKITELRKKLRELKKQEPDSCGKHMNIEIEIKKLQREIK